jgi:hypothetical protein
MRVRKAVVGALCAGAAVVLPATAAFASGPGGGSGNGSGSNGRNQTMVDCNGQEFTVAVTNGGKSSSAGQIVDAKGHGIPAFGTFTITDTTANVVLLSNPIGHGNGHPNQTLTECTSTTPLGTVADLGPPPPGGYPPGVKPSDTVEGHVDVFVVLQP